MIAASQRCTAFARPHASLLSPQPFLSGRSRGFQGPHCLRRASSPQQGSFLARSGVRRAVVAMAAADGTTKVLFVCLGNICRSPTAEAVFTKVVQDAGLEQKFTIDSCGTGGGSPDWYMPGGFSYHEGDAADSRMRAAASGRGVKLTSRSRPLKPADLAEFDYIVGMDASNLVAIRRAAEYWAGSGRHAVPEDWSGKLSLMSDFLRSERFKRYDQVPDPYYGGSSGFELVLDLLDDACLGFLDHIQQEQPAANK